MSFAASALLLFVPPDASCHMFDVWEPVVYLRKVQCSGGLCIKADVACGDVSCGDWAFGVVYNACNSYDFGGEYLSSQSVAAGFFFYPRMMKKKMMEEDGMDNAAFRVQML